MDKRNCRGSVPGRIAGRRREKSVPNGKAAVLIRILLTAIIMWSLGGCGPRHYVYERTNPENIRRIAVIPLENFTPDEFAGEKIRRIVISDLLSRQIDVVEPGEITRVIRESKIKSLSSVKVAELQQIGQASGADAIIAGSVECYGLSKGVSVTYPEVTVSLRLIESSSGRILWSVRHTSGGASFWTRHLGSEGKSLSEASDRVVRESLDTLF